MPWALGRLVIGSLGFGLGAVLVPFVNHEVEVLQVTLLVERKVAGRSIEGIAAQRRSSTVLVGQRISVPQGAS